MVILRELMFLLAALLCASLPQMTFVQADWLLKQVMCYMF